MKVSITCKLADFGIVSFVAQFGLLRNELAEIRIESASVGANPIELTSPLKIRLLQASEAYWHQFLKQTYAARADYKPDVKLWS